MTDIPGHTGRDTDGVAKAELDHFAECPVCGALLDMRDLAQVMAHAHDQNVEESNGEPLAS
jgi:predicted protein tyrosine phosphatase